MKNIIYLSFLFLFLFVFTSCEQEDGINPDLINKSKKSKEISSNEDYIIVAPSTDISGVTDANNIEAALNEAKVFGGTVYLTDGDESTVDHYYTSRNIVVEGFDGTLKGEDRDNTIINAGRKSKTVGFKGAHSPYSGEGFDDLATIFQLDNSVGDVIITDLAILVKDDQPTDIQPDFYGRDATYITTFIEILGGEHNTIIENVRLEGKKSNAFGNEQGMNIGYGIHVMLSSLFSTGKGNLTIEDVELTNIGWGAVIFMQFKDGSKITIEDVMAKNVGQGIYAGTIFDSSVKISEMNISIHSLGYQGIDMWNIPSGLEVKGNAILGSNFYGVLLRGISNAQIIGNSIKDHYGYDGRHYGITVLFSSNNNYIADNKFVNLSGEGGGIRIDKGSKGNRVEKNDFKSSNLPGWTISTPNGPGAIYLGSSTQNNEIFEMKFPTGKDISQMVRDYGINNTIHNFESSEDSVHKEDHEIELDDDELKLKSKFRFKHGE